MFDTAVSEKRSRQILANLLLSAEVVFEDNRYRDGRDFLSWSKELGLVLSEESIYQYPKHAQSSRNAEGLFLWLQKRRVSVKHVNLVCWQNITDTGMRVLGESCSRLESLTMYRCDNVTDEGIKDVATGCSGLQSLSLDSCRQVTDTGVSRLADGCSMLQSLNLSAYCPVTDTGLGRLAEGCRLEVLCLNILASALPSRGAQ